MFHHFHDEKKHIIEQGSISSEEFNELLDYYSNIYNIISADEYFFNSQNDNLSGFDVCLSFDDGLLCQYDVAFPVLEQRGLKAFWFIYTSQSDGILEKLEIYRHFRFSKFNNINDFYSAFFETAMKENKNIEGELQKFNPDEYAKDFPFYTPNDKRFRYLRDYVLSEKEYNSIMDNMIDEYKYNISENSDLLWIKNEQIKNLYKHGHIIGLHSHTHPTVMHKKSFNEQLYEYGTNKEHLESIINDKIFAVSYPCNSYNKDSLRCMHELNIQIGFRANMKKELIEDIKLEYPREDHSNIMKIIRQNKHNKEN